MIVLAATRVDGPVVDCLPKRLFERALANLLKDATRFKTSVGQQSDDLVDFLRDPYELGP